MQKGYTTMKKWYLIDVCGEIAEDITELPIKYQTREKAIEYGLNYWKALVDWQKNVRTEFYVALCTIKRNGTYKEYESYDCTVR